MPSTPTERGRRPIDPNPTVTNLTSHSYFNLAGEDSPAGSEYSQFVQINARDYSPTDSSQIPLPLADGVPVAGTPFDFRAPHTIGSRIDDVSAPDNVPASFASATGGKSQLLIAQGYDHNWILNPQTPGTTGPLGLNLAARASDPHSGRELTVWTDQPGVQFYAATSSTARWRASAATPTGRARATRSRPSTSRTRPTSPTSRAPCSARETPSTRQRSSPSAPDTRPGGLEPAQPAADPRSPASPAGVRPGH